MRPYSIDLRQRVVAALDAGEGSQPEIAARFRVSVSFITRLLKRRCRTGSVTPAPHGGGHPPALDRAARQRLRRLVRERPDAMLEELAARGGVPCGRMAIFRTLRTLKITRKKKSLHASERDTPRVRRKRRAFRKAVDGLDPRRLVFVDETGAHTAMTRTYGRAPRGQRVRGSVPGHWKSVTLIAGLRLSGVVTPLAFEGAMDATTFEGYVRKALALRLGAGDVVLWDNLKPHESAGARRAVEGAGAHLLPLPPYSPDYGCGVAGGVPVGHPRLVQALRPLRNPIVKRSNRVTPTTFPSVIQDQLRNLQIIAPPKSLQNEFAVVFRQIEQIVSKRQSVASHSKFLIDSLVQRAFRGEL